MIVLLVVTGGSVVWEQLRVMRGVLWQCEVAFSFLGDMVELYTDGASKGNPGRGGYAAILRGEAYDQEYVKAYEHTTNNRMELLAVIAGLEALEGGHAVTIYADSRYVVDAINRGWLKKWRAQGLSKRKNSDLWARLLRAAQPHTVAYQWVQGHAGHPLNERCDALASQAAQQGPWEVDQGYSGILSGA